MDYKIVPIKPMNENTRDELDRYLADVCFVVRNKDIKHPHSLTKRLLKESYGDKPSSVFSFVPCTVDKEIAEYQITKKRFMFCFGFAHNASHYYRTNLRELLSWDWSLDEALKHIDFTYYKAFTAVAPYMTYGQIRTHSQIQFLSHSARYSDVDYGYFMPNEVLELLTKVKLSTNTEEAQNSWNQKVQNVSPNELTSFMKDCGIKRKEIYNRGSDSLKIRPFSIGLNILNPNASEHFFNQRKKDEHTQLETRMFAEELYRKVYEHK